MAGRSEALEAERAMRELQRRFDGDMYCADCGLPSPEYVNLTAGAFICKTCASIHRGISNRRIKDIYTGELSMEDVRRMSQVGGESSACNDRVNRRFLHLWDPREFPQPETGDEERLRNFIWLKYEGSWKKAAQAPQSAPAQHQQDPYSRERELFRNTRSSSGTSQPPPPARADWAERLGHAAPQLSRFSEPSHSNRTPSRDRFNPPSATAFARRPERSKGYDRDPTPPAHYREEYEDDYERRGERRRESARGDRHSSRGDTRDRPRDREREPERTRDRDRERDRDHERGRSRSYRSKKTSHHVTDSEYEEESEDEVAQRRRTRKTKERRDYEDSVDDSSEADDYASRKKKSSKQKKREARRKQKRREAELDADSDDEDANSLPSTVGSARLPTEPATVTAPAKAEFDLMSDWMGSNDAATTQTATSVPQPQAQPQAPSATGGVAAVPPQIPQAATQPMSMYGGVMPNPAAAYMTAYYPMGVGIPMMPMGMPPPMANVVGGMASMSLAPQAQALAAQQMQAQQPMQPHQLVSAQQPMLMQPQQHAHPMMQQPVPAPPTAAFQPPPPGMTTYQGPAPPPPPTIAAYQGPAPPPPSGPPPA